MLIRRLLLPAAVAALAARALPQPATGQVALKAKGQVARSRHENINYVAGTCGITQNPGGWDDPKPPTDCGTRLVNYAIQLSPEGAAGTRITPDVLLGENGIREKLGYTNCGLITPSNVVAGSWPAATGRIMAGTTPVRSLFGHQRTFVAKGHEQWDGRQPVQTVSETATTTIDWTLKFTRVR